MSKSYLSRKCSRPRLQRPGLPPMKSGPSWRVYRSGWMAPSGLAGGAEAEAETSACPRDGMNSGERQRPRLARADVGIGELHAELAIEARLDCDGDGVRSSPPELLPWPGDDDRMSREAARSGDGDRLAARSGKLDECVASGCAIDALPSGANVLIWGDEPRWPYATGSLVTARNQRRTTEITGRTERET